MKYLDTVFWSFAFVGYLAGVAALGAYGVMGR